MTTTLQILASDGLPRRRCWLPWNPEVPALLHRKRADLLARRRYRNWHPVSLTRVLRFGVPCIARRIVEPGHERIFPRCDAVNQKLPVFVGQRFTIILQMELLRNQRDVSAAQRHTRRI